ncbi:MAG: TlpA family protein disulfide reductase [Thermodesulfobacteria bacterium]|nr:TlpA family protein disulfide reductase [Thermodesulfobacteriota bacterium]
MKRLIVGFLFILILITIPLYSVRAKSLNFSFFSYNGTKYELSNFKGKYIVLNFFASYCPMCMLELNTLEKLSRSCDGKKLQVISLIIDKQGWPLLPYIVKTHHLTYIVGIAPEGVFKLFPDFSILPTSFIISPQGKLIKTITGLLPEVKFKEILSKFVSCN